MKSFNILLVIALLISCHAPYNRIRNLPPKTNFISFNIELIGEPSKTEATRVKFIFQNLRSDSIVVMEPLCLGLHVWPILIDSAGTPQSFLFYGDRGCRGALDTLGIGEKYERIFKYKLEECFDFSQKGPYELSYEYYGYIYELKGYIIANEKPIVSNKVGFEIK